MSDFPTNDAGYVGISFAFVFAFCLVAKRLDNYTEVVGILCDQAITR